MFLKTPHRTVPSTVVLTWLAGCTLVSGGVVLDDQPTPHPYAEAIRALGNAGISTEEWLVEGASPADGAVWDPELARSVLAKSARAIELAGKVSPQARTAVDSTGPGSLDQDLSQLSTLRRLSRLMAMQARDYRTRGLNDEANRVLTEIGALSRNVASEGALEASLAANACAGNAMNGIEEAIALGTVDSNQAATLRRSLGEEPDPLGCALGIRNDRQRMLPWLRSNPVLATAISGPFPPGVSFEDAVLGIETGFDRMQEILSTADSREARGLLDDFRTSLQTGEHGPLAEEFLANHARMADIKIDFQERRDALDGSLRDIQLGADPIDHANAATLYAHAFPHVGRLDDEQQDALETVRRYATTIRSTGSVPAESLERAREVLVGLDTLRSLIERAGRCTRCEWPQALRAERLDKTIGEGDWLRPMRALSRVLLAEAVVARADGRDEDARRAVADGLAIALHLADGSHLLGTAVASSILAEITEVMALDPVGVFDSDSSLERRLARVDSSDPLGWSAARRAALRGGGQDRANRWPRRLRSLEDDALAAIDYLLVADGQGGYRLRNEKRTRHSGILFGLEEVVALTADARRRLQRSTRTPEPLLLIVREIKPVDVDRWRRTGYEALEEIERRLDHHSEH